MSHIQARSGSVAGSYSRRPYCKHACTTWAARVPDPLLPVLKKLGDWESEPLRAGSVGRGTERAVASRGGGEILQRETVNTPVGWQAFQAFLPLFAGGSILSSPQLEQTAR